MKTFRKIAASPFILAAIGAALLDCLMGLAILIAILGLDLSAAWTFFLYGVITTVGFWVFAGTAYAIWPRGQG